MTLCSSPKASAIWSVPSSSRARRRGVVLLWISVAGRSSAARARATAEM
ncbi:hypothetical protein [Halosaccharopolyspora lacisalsi]|nr:hypothetical protein [Halosaccharopolyspora lacisalsi]